MLKEIIKANHRLALKLAIIKEVMSAQKLPSCGKGATLKGLGEKVAKIKGGAANKCLQ